MKKILIILLFLSSVINAQIDGNKEVTFVDLQWLIDNGGFLQKNDFNENSLECPNKLEVIDALWIIESNLNALTDLQLVKRSLLEAEPIVPPTTPILTTTYSGAPADWIQNSWTESIARTAGAYITEYELDAYIDDVQSVYYSATYTVAELGGIMSQFVNDLSRNCLTFKFRIRSIDNNTTPSAWSNWDSADPVLEKPYLTTRWSSSNSWDTNAYHHDGGIRGIAITNDGDHISIFQDEDHEKVTIFSFALGTSDDMDTFDNTGVSFDHLTDLGSIGSIIKGGFISDDGKTAYILTGSKDVVKLTSTLGWNISTDFSKVTSYDVDLIEGAVTDIAMSPDGKTMFISDSSGRIYDFVSTTSWDHSSWSPIHNTINIGNIPLLPGFYFERILDFSFIENGLGIVLSAYIRYQDIDNSEWWEGRYYVELSEAYNLGSNKTYHGPDIYTMDYVVALPHLNRSIYQAWPRTGTFCSNYMKCRREGDPASFNFYSRYPN